MTTPTKFDPTKMRDYGVPSLTNWDMESEEWKERMQGPTYRKLMASFRISAAKYSDEKSKLGE